VSANENASLPFSLECRNAPLIVYVHQIGTVAFSYLCLELVLVLIDFILPRLLHVNISMFRSLCSIEEKNVVLTASTKNGRE
jgi:hypothetical protein